jgi:hypothetical protein
MGLVNPGGKRPVTGKPAGDGLPMSVVADIERGFDLQLMSWGNGSGVPTSGNNLVIVGIDNKGLVHVRTFDADGNEITDTDETKLPATKTGAISTLRQRLPGLLPPHALTRVERSKLISEATSIVDQILEYTESAEHVNYKHWLSQYGSWIGVFEDHRPAIEVKIEPKMEVEEVIYHWKHGWDNETFRAYHERLQKWHAFLHERMRELERTRKNHEKKHPGLKLPLPPMPPDVPPLHRPKKKGIPNC